MGRAAFVLVVASRAIAPIAERRSADRLDAVGLDAFKQVGPVVAGASEGATGQLVGVLRESRPCSR
jgi:hypothetical protein